MYRQSNQFNRNSRVVADHDRSAKTPSQDRAQSHHQLDHLNHNSSSNHHNNHHHHHHHHNHPDQRHHHNHHHHHHNSNNYYHHHDKNRFHSISNRNSFHLPNQIQNRSIDRRIDLNSNPSVERNSSNSIRVNSSTNNHLDDQTNTNNKRSFDESRRSLDESNRESNHSRRLDQFPPSSRSNRYNPYPTQSTSRNEPHPQSINNRLNNNSNNLHTPQYHSNATATTSTTPPNNSINSSSNFQEHQPANRHLDHPPHHHYHHHHHHPRTFDPNSQFNHGPPKDKSPPSQSVIFMGLPIHTDEANLRAFLEEAGASVDHVTIIYDRNTGQSKRYGFARFISVEHAKAFVEPAFPMVVWKEPNASRFDKSGDGLKVKIDYSQKEKVPFEVRQRERELTQRGGLSSSSFTNEPVQNHFNLLSESPLSVINDGARDIGGTPTSILLLRGLDPLSTEQEIAHHLQHIPDPSQTVLPDSIRKVMLIKDRLTHASWGYAFVQFAEVQVAVKALSLLLNTSLFPRGFQIRSRTITVTFAHEHSFHPVYTPSDWSFKGPGGQELAYWDDKAYAALYISSVTESHHHSSLSSTPDSSRHRHLKSLSPPIHNDKSMEQTGNAKDQDIEVDELLSSIDAEPQRQSSENVISLTNRENSLERDVKTNLTDHNPSNQDQKPNQDSSSPIHPPAHDSEPQENPSETKQALQNDKVLKNSGEELTQQESIHLKGNEALKAEKKKSVEPIATKKMVANIQKWQTKHQEIANPKPEQENSNEAQLVQNVVIEEDDFSDLNRMTCVLCQRQFRSPEDLKRHNNLSNLHKGNLQNEKLKRAARLRKAASIRANLAKQTNGEGTMKYTDRAAARREAYGQPDAPNADKHEAKKARYEPAPAPVLPPAQPDKDGIQETNVGSKMLEKMGWQKGEGLGNGNGRVDPIMASQYNKGVGLGASTGTVVGKYDDNQKGFLEQVKDKTLQRFNED
ncbi:hypothetical protein O181_008756 [Austropuccinia psidii MF-1]|uniref:G-patch domain-containing protein n=1 Tax=Austropuccinia psidii MF-1 TaxID=1389203 RepID=A0A9Q3BQG1_9BASI|nr:hypothetical protein [Austropuccinia psidii MF-1]